MNSGTKKTNKFKCTGCFVLNPNYQEFTIRK